MSYYRYLKQYSPGFLRKYQTGTYAALSRSTQFKEIAQMNATSTLSIDEDLTLNLSVPFNITNFMAFVALIYWYFYHVDMNLANSIKNRLRSYHNYKMWTRLEYAVVKCNVDHGKLLRTVLENRWLSEKRMTRPQYNELLERSENGESVEDIIASWGLKLDSYNDRLVKA